MSSKEKISKKVRLTLDLSPEFYERLVALEELVDANSKSDLIREALRLYEYMYHRVLNDGAKVQVVRPSGEIETLVLFGP